MTSRIHVRSRRSRALGLVVAGLLALAVGVGSATGRSTGNIPQVVTPPAVSGLFIGQTLSATVGTWSSDTPVSTYLQWVRIFPNGGKQPIAGATGPTYTVAPGDVGDHFQVQVKAENAVGPNWVNSDTSAIVVGPKTVPVTGGSSVAAADVALPNRFVVSSVTFSPSALKAGGSVTAKVVVTDVLGNFVNGAQVKLTVVPYDAVSPQPAAVQTGADGSGTVTPKAAKTLRVSGGAAVFVSATKEGGNPLGDVSASRLVRLPLGG